MGVQWRNSESALVSLDSTQSIDMAFPVRWLSRFAKLINNLTQVL